eukprot:4103080-Pyramimonas_sp.AAC.1
MLLATAWMLSKGGGVDDTQGSRGGERGVLIALLCFMLLATAWMLSRETRSHIRSFGWPEMPRLRPVATFQNMAHN